MVSKEDDAEEFIQVERELLKGQRLELAPGIFVTVASAGGGKTQLGIDAPPEITILRAELNQPVKE